LWWPRNPNRSLGAAAQVVGLRAGQANRLPRLACVLLLAATAHAQSRGQAEISFQGYYLAGNNQPLLDTSGMAFRFQEFVPGLGFLSGSLEGYGSQNRLQTGENFLELRGVPWMGQHWTATGGDFHTPAALVEFPFYNIFTPEITARGVKIQANHEDRQYTFFAGEETLTAGPRVPYRLLVPQRLIGGSAARGIGKRLRVGARFLQFSSNPQDMAANPFLFPAGRTASLVRTFSAQSLFTPFQRLKLYAEASRPIVAGQRALTSSLVGLSWDTRRFTFRTNFARQGAFYYPLAGYFSGDREGPFAEARYRPWKRLEFYASASRYRNNLEGNSDLAVFHSTNSSAGASGTLPGRLSAAVQFSTVRFTSQLGGEDPLTSRNRQISANLSRTLGRHSLHVNWRDIKIDAMPVSQRQRSHELEDMYMFRHMFFGAAVRYQQTTGSEQRNSLYFRGTAQANAGRFSAYANVEVGNDLVNRTLFATNAYSTTVIGVAVRLLRDWNLQTEVFRNRLNMDLNPESIFALQSGGVPVSQSITSFNQWSFYFRLTRQIRWRGGMPTENLDQFAARVVPLVGTVEGVVSVSALAGRTPAAGIPVTLDQARVATTSADGRYRFDEVPEGEHVVALSATELPADYDPGMPKSALLLVQPRRLVRTDFEVLPLVSLQGKVSGPDGAALDGIVIRLTPGSRYTITSADGRFAIYNLREGDYELAVDAKSLPENAELSSPAGVPVAVRLGTPTARVEFSLKLNSPQKPVRKVLDRQ